MSRNKEYLKNTFILFIGKFATQFTSLLLIPLFTNYLLESDYGLVDLYLTYITLFVPILTLRLDSAVFRYLIDQRKNEDGKKNIISNVFIVLVTIISIVAVLSIPILLLVKIKYIELVIVNIAVLMFSNVLLQVLRGIGKTKEYSICSIITGITTLIVNTTLILLFNFGASSILIASIISNILCSIFVVVNANIPKYIEKKYIEKNEIKKLLSYSVPLIPNSLSWWVINVSDRTIITFFLNSALNGIYAISCKFSNILNSIFSIFNLSWQETISLHIKDEDADSFITDMGNRLLFLFGSVSLFIVGLLPLIYPMIVGARYISSYQYVPVLLFSNILNVLSCITSGIYVGMKETRKIANTTITSAITNILINIVLVRYIGLWGAVVSTLISYLVVSIYRYIDCKRYVNFKLQYNKILLFVVIYIASSLLYMYNYFYLNIINFVVILSYIIVFNKEYIQSLFTFFRKKLGGNYDKDDKENISFSSEN